MRLFEYRKQFIKTLKNKYSEKDCGVMFKYLLEDLLNLDFATVINSEQELEQTSINKLENALEQLLEDVPLQYINKRQFFYENSFYVDERVLIPRPETEELVDWVLQSNTKKTAKVLDIGTGSGCIAISLKLKRPNWQVQALDVSEEALEVARYNAKALEADVDFLSLNILDKAACAHLTSFDIIVSNPPYIMPEEQTKMSVSTLKYEPKIALFTQASPLLFYKAIAEYAKEALKLGGQLFFECNEFNAISVKQWLLNNTFEKVNIKQDMQGKNRMISAVLVS